MPQKELFNFRDIGGAETRCGRRVKRKRLFRSGNLSDISERAAEFLTRDQNVGVYIDFRAEDEVKRFGRPESLIKSGVEWINLHIDTNDEVFNAIARPMPEDWIALYVRLIDKNMKAFVEFSRIIVEAPSAVIYGCLFGKDRTGIATSLLLNELNVQDEHIIRDYSLTTTGLHPHYVRLNSLWEGTGLSEEEILTYYLNASPKIIEDFLKIYRSKAAQELRHVCEEIASVYRERLQQKLLEPK